MHDDHRRSTASRARLELARELGATHVDRRHASSDAAEEIRRITGFGADFSVETTGVPALLREAVECLAPRGMCGVIGAAAIGTDVAIDMATILTAGAACAASSRATACRRRCCRA